ncbi:LLM class flavin-dependent oxidoreductase [Planomonospora corallina]|uniref:LLM class flavin-dependent oxidoreductase n=1 Tax=Planomonospora corallina TaxID=1806052 RepID=A0ABV8I8I2_9ACTN
MIRPLHLAVALDGAGWHPAAWRQVTARPEKLFSARYWAGLVAEAERGLLDFVTIEDSLALQTSLPDAVDERTDQVRGRFGAVLLAARLAPLTRNIGLVPTATTTHTEPFHVAVGIATLDHVSGGRAGWRPRVSARRAEAGNVGRREIPELDPAAPDAELLADLFEEAADVVDVTPHDRGHAESIVGQVRSAPPRREAAEGLRRPRRLPGKRRGRAQGAPRRAGRGRVHLRRRRVHRHPGGAGRPAAGLARGRDRRLPAAPRQPAVRPEGRHPRPDRGLRRRGAFHAGYEARTLRGLLGLPRPANRYAGAVTP